MDDQSLPADLSRLVVRGSNHPAAPDQTGVRPAPATWGAGMRGRGQQVDQNEANGPGGVCSAASAPTLAPWPAPVPLIPDQPRAPGTPASLASAMDAPVTDTPGSPPAPTTPTPSLGADASPVAKTVPVGPAAMGTPVPNEPVKRPGRTHPRKPLTPIQIAEFANLWNDAEYTVAQIARRYGCGERTVQDWRVELGLAPHPVLVRARVAAETKSAEGTAISPTAPHQSDPSKDPEIVEALRDIWAEARIMSPHSDLQVIQRKLARLSILIATKTPLRSWETTQITVDGLAKSVLHARRVEAEIPRGDVDPVMLRKEAAGQLMSELKSVLTPAEQQALATLVKVGADRMMAKGGQNSASNDLPGAPSSSLHNGKC